MFISSNIPQAIVFVAVRHGLSDHNYTPAFSEDDSELYWLNSNPDHENYTESHLTEKGRLDVKKTAEQLACKVESLVDAYISPLPRTQETWAIIEGEIQKVKKGITIRPTLAPQLTEAQAGDLEGQYGKYPGYYPKRNGLTPESAKTIGKINNKDRSELRTKHGYETNESIEKRTHDFVIDLLKDLALKIQKKEEIPSHIFLISHDVTITYLDSALKKIGLVQEEQKSLHLPQAGFREYSISVANILSQY
jgi:broad specificity phosphatase PhoE